jgi:short-subunit dehydrogenase
VVAISEVLYREMRADKHPVDVSVLCPGLVNTRIVSSARNRPQSGTQRVRDPEAVHRREVFRSNLQRAGMDPLEVADKVVAAIRVKQFWILTHPNDMDRVWERNESLRIQSDLPD